MAARGSKSTRRTKDDAERTRLYQARAEFHDRLVRRRIRDNTIAGLVGGVLVIGAFASQAVHAEVAPEPTASASTEPSATPTPASTEDPFADLYPTTAP